MQLFFDQFEQKFAEEVDQELFYNRDPILTTAISTGVVVWVIQAGQFAAAVLSTAPAWVQLDPLTVLDRQSKEEEKAAALFDKPQK